jgi:hypothetical protein
VAGCCEYDDELSGSGATELVNKFCCCCRSCRCGGTMPANVGI